LDIQDDIGVFAEDIFADEALRDPYPLYAALRNLGGVVRLEDPDVYAIGRFADVRDALRADTALVSGRGIGFNASFNTPPGPNVIQSDGELHKRLRAELLRPLTPAQLKDARADLQRMIDTKIASLIDVGTFDAMAEIARFLPLQAIAHLVGISPDGREHMLEWAAASFNLMGPERTLKRSDVESIKEARHFMGGLTIEKLREGSWAHRLFQTVESGRLTREEAIGAVSAYLLPSLDTTILAKGHLLHNLATCHDQFELVRDHPSLITAAVLEGLRHSSPLRWFARVASDDYRVGVQMIPAGSRVMLLYGCANRDERRYENPDAFDVRRDARDHLAWGTGPHMCIGMHLARIEMEVMLEALVKHDLRLEVDAPIIGANKGLYGFEELPMRLLSR